MWKFRNFSATQILREINWEIFLISEALQFDFGKIQKFSRRKCTKIKIQSTCKLQNANRYLSQLISRNFFLQIKRFSLQQISLIYDPLKFGQEKLSISISDDSHSNLNFQTPKLLQRSQTRLKISQLAKVQLVSKKIVNWAICYNLDKSVRHETHFILE